MTRARKRDSAASKLSTKLYIKPKSLKPKEVAPLPSFESLPVNKAQCSKAVDALVQYAKRKVEQKQDTDLLAGEENEDVWLGVTLKRMSPKDNVKPVRIPLPNPLLDPRKNPVCLLVKDPQREYKDLLEEKKIKFVSRVVGMEKLQGKFKPHEARRQLMKEHDLFLVDDRIVPEMPRVLGKQWLQTKKSPIPVTLKRVDLKAELERAISSTYLRINKGTSVAVKIGSLAEHTAAQLRENLVAAIPHLAVRLPMGGWDNVQSLHIKTTSSAALPLWNCALDLPGEESKEGRFFVADVDEDEVEAKKQAKKEKEERIKAKKARKLGGPVSASQLAIEAGGEDEESTEENGNASAADLTSATVETQEGFGDDDEDASPALEDIDESLVVPPSPSSSAAASPKPKAKASKDKKQKADTSSTKKTTSSTSKKMKGLEAVKGMPRKVKQK